MVRDCAARCCSCSRYIPAAAPVLGLARRYFPHREALRPTSHCPRRKAHSVSLKDYRGKWVVLYFYPKDQTPGCTREAHNFQIDQSKYNQRNSVVLGVSVDSVDSHKKFCAKEGLNFKLLADSDGKVSREYGSLTNLGVVKFAARHTFLIDPAGKVAKSIYATLTPAGTAKMFWLRSISCRSPVVSVLRSLRMARA
jgi:thioredoxin-dependent peroxiredoxin